MRCYAASIEDLRTATRGLTVVIYRVGGQLVVIAGERHGEFVRSVELERVIREQKEPAKR